MRHLRPADYRVMAWKNGLGSTTEIAVYPPGSGIAEEPFLWRVSIADVPASGPFSRFPGYDRTIMMISGETGMWLDGAPDGPIDLTRPFCPRAFSGDRDITGRLVGGPLRDFNLMVDRARAKGTMTVIRQPCPLRLAAPDGGQALVTLFSGSAKLAGIALEVGETLLLDSNETAEGLVEGGKSASVAAALVMIAPLQAAQAPAS